MPYSKCLRERDYRAGFGEEHPRSARAQSFITTAIWVEGERDVEPNVARKSRFETPLQEIFTINLFKGIIDHYSLPRGRVLWLTSTMTRL